MSFRHLTAPHQLLLYMLPVPTLGTRLSLLAVLPTIAGISTPPPLPVTMAKEKHNSVPSVAWLQMEQRRGTETKYVAEC